MNWLTVAVEVWAMVILSVLTAILFLFALAVLADMKKGR
jgi:hypothetical protein